MDSTTTSSGARVAFRDDATGRHPAVLSGLDVAEVVDVMRKLETRGEDPVPATATWLRITEDAVRAAAGYHEAYREESPEPTSEPAVSVVDAPSSG